MKKVDILKEKISKQELFQYYIIDNHSFIETAEYFNVIPSGCLHDLLKLYDIRKNPKARSKNNKFTISHTDAVERGKKSSETQKINWKNKSQQEKDDWSRKCIESHSTNSAKENMSNAQKKSRNYLKSYFPDIECARNKSRSNTLKILWSTNKDYLIEQRKIKTKENKKNPRFRSNIEFKVFNELSKHYIVEYDVKKDNYPYYVDFYIPEIDLFIELNAHPSHGSRPYDKDDVKSLEESYKLYGDWLNTYTNRDVEKYYVATKNNLNYLRIYPKATIEENYLFNDNKFKDIIDIIYNA